MFHFRCSRKQCSLISDCNEFKVKLTQLGLNTSRARGEAIGVGKTVTLSHEDTIEVLDGHYKYKLFFDPAPPMNQNDNGKAAVKRETSDNSEAEMPLSKKVKTVGRVPWFDESLGDLVSDDDGRGGEWRKLADGRLYVRLVEGDEGSSKIAAFDIDGTLITTQSGRVFPKDEHDWRIIYSEVPGKLKNLVEDGFKLVFITNQAGIAKGKLTIEQFSGKVVRILTRLGINATVFVSTAETGYYRKPRPGIWEWLEASGNSGVKVVREESFYCGDAAGREAGWSAGKKKDFSCSDRLFAENIEVKFLTPEEFFLGHKATSKFTRPFKPIRGAETELLDPITSRLVPSSLILSLMVGIQGSGKSNVARMMEQQGVVIASNDMSGGKEKTLRIVETALSKGQSVVVDNTHVDIMSRKSYIELGLKYDAKVRAMVMTTSHEQARHNNTFREITDTSHTRIKEILFNQYRAKHEPPTVSEGFSEIIKVNLVPSFTSDDLDNLYHMYLLEK